ADLRMDGSPAFLLFCLPVALTVRIVTPATSLMGRFSTPPADHRQLNSLNRTGRWCSLDRSKNRPARR
ncbi:MAG: hypothetical protein M3Z21_11795, partial [Pseudomonadota bacterium]|nr:hypothetical protein [Pseudomonadota bacterium]